MKTYLTNLLTEKGITSSIYNDMPIDGHFELTYEMQIDFICSMPQPIQQQIRKTFVKIDFANGDVKHFWDHMTTGMLESCVY
ncbi:hypothetical protein LCGC14_1210760 [marine sediment metagenome]|uniref:Uncharacterized protein n=2 Tax=root TaxID=1 RepID=A0A831QJW2_9FLAO|nr:hypothetical protein [Pricia sp.]HEA19625.1 hypothetical protein [Pricia antarctica]